MKILIVDDDADIRDSLAELFEAEGYSVTTAADGSAGLLALNADTLPCVIILDLLMPVLDGNDMYRMMQADPRLASVPVIVSTSEPARAPKGVVVIKKPVNLARLLSAVRQHCPQPSSSPS